MYDDEPRETLTLLDVEAVQIDGSRRRIGVVLCGDLSVTAIYENQKLRGYRR